MRAAVELAKDWRTDKYLRNLEALMIVADKDVLLILTVTRPRRWAATAASSKTCSVISGRLAQVVPAKAAAQAAPTEANLNPARQSPYCGV